MKTPSDWNYRPREITAIRVKLLFGFLSRTKLLQIKSLSRKNAGLSYIQAQKQLRRVRFVQKLRSRKITNGVNTSNVIDINRRAKSKAEWQNRSRRQIGKAA